MQWIVGAALYLIASIWFAESAIGKEPDRNLTVGRQDASLLQSERRVALVIGNGAYQTAPLANPVRDATAMAAVLTRAGFMVVLKTDINQREFLASVRDFGDKLRGGGTGLFYFAGHGMQIKGRNYLIPVGATIEREDEVPYLAVDAQAVLDKMEGASNSANVLILDACRNNPFARSFRSSAQGLAQMDAPSGTLVAFSTAPGSVASDGAGEHGLYTAHLLTAMGTPGLKVEDVFKRTRVSVRRDSQGKQTPWESTSLEGDLYFFGAPAGSTQLPTPATPPNVVAGALGSTVTPASEEASWEQASKSLMSADFVSYLSRFPNGRYAAAAKEALAKIAGIGDPPSPSAFATVGSDGVSDESLWLVAVRSQSAADFVAYLQRFPNGKHALEARQAIERKARH